MMQGLREYALFSGLTPKIDLIRNGTCTCVSLLIDKHHVSQTVLMYPWHQKIGVKEICNVDTCRLHAFLKI